VYTNTTASNLEEAVTDVSDAFSNDIDLSVIENIFYTLMPEAITSTSSSLIDKLQNILDAESNIKDSRVSIEEVDVNEYYKNLKPFIDEFEKDDNKIVCGNIFARRDMPWHIGDHIIICKTVDLLKAVENLINHYNNKFQSLEKYMVQREQNTAELILCLAILQQKDAKIDYLDYSDYKDEFLNYISIVDINKAEEFVAQWKHGNRKYINLFTNHHHVKDSDDY